MFCNYLHYFGFDDGSLYYNCEAVIVTCNDFNGGIDYGTWSDAVTTVPAMRIGNVRVTEDAIHLASGDTSVVYDLERLPQPSGGEYGSNDPKLYSGKGCARSWSGTVDGMTVHIMAARSGEGNLLVGVLYQSSPVPLTEGAKRLIGMGIAIPYGCFGSGASSHMAYTDSKTAGHYSWPQQWYYTMAANLGQPYILFGAVANKEIASMRVYTPPPPYDAGADTLQVPQL